MHQQVLFRIEYNSAEHLNIGTACGSPNQHSCYNTKITFISHRNATLPRQSRPQRDYGLCVPDPLRSGSSRALVQLLLRLGNSSGALVRRRPARRDGGEDTEESRAPVGGPETFHVSQLDCSSLPSTRNNRDWTVAA